MTPSAALALATEPAMIVHSDLLGTLDVSPDELVEFPAGLLGFPECRSFVLLPSERDGLYWLQSAEHSPLAFLLVDPFLSFDGYAVDLAAADLAELGAQSASEVAILAIVTLPRTRQEQCTVNLQGPVAFNLEARRAKQLVIPNSDQGVQAPIDLATLG